MAPGGRTGRGTAGRAGRGDGARRSVLAPNPKMAILLAMNALTDPMLADLDARVAALAQKSSKALRGLPDAALDRTPPAGGWSPGQILDHVLTVDLSYFDVLRAALAQPGARAAGRTPWQPSWLGKVFLWALRPGNAIKAKTPSRFDPPKARDHVVDIYLAHLDELRAILREAEGADFARVRVVSPATTLVRFNLGDALNVLVTHAERHHVQLERTLAAQSG